MSILDDMKEERREEVRRDLAQKGLLVGDEARVRVEPLTMQRAIAGTVVRLFEVHDANVTVETKHGMLVNIPEYCLFPKPRTTNSTRERRVMGEEMKFPELKPIKGGWAAFGDGWAVHGETEEEAVRLYHEAVERHREMDARVESPRER